MEVGPMDAETDDARTARPRGCGGVRRCRVLEVMDGDQVEWRLASDDGQEPMVLRGLVWMPQSESMTPVTAGT